MPTIIHRKGNRYREWSIIVDAYTTRSMTRDAMAEYLREQASAEARHEIAARLARADAQGTSAVHDTRDALSWDTERCRRCKSFHHGYQPRADATCAECGEAEDHTAHKPPCGKRRKRAEGTEGR